MTDMRPTIKKDGLKVKNYNETTKNNPTIKGNRMARRVLATNSPDISITQRPTIHFFPSFAV